MTQRSLFPSGAEAITSPVILLNRSVPAEAAPRLRKQCVRLLDALRTRDLTNYEIVSDLRILNLTARVSELRQAGYDVQIAEQDRKTGRCLYRLISEPSASEEVSA